MILCAKPRRAADQARAVGMLGEMRPRATSSDSQWFRPRPMLDVERPSIMDVSEDGVSAEFAA
jgi:hypothetical protein